MTTLSQYALDRMLDRLIQDGHLRIVMPDGTTRGYGDQSRDPVTVRLIDPATTRRLVVNPELALGEAYMNGSLTVDGDDLQGLLALVIRNARHADANPVLWQKLTEKARTALRGLTQNNIVNRASRNVAHHYDLSERLFDLFLDEDRQYSCGYFRDPDAALDQAQIDKKTHIARKLMIEPGMTVLDIGCGWGGLALTLAKEYGAKVVGITLSKEQCAYATARVERAGLSDQIQFRLCDYRQTEGKFDRIVSVGMFEHVGLRHYHDYFATIRNRLSSDGIALIHTIGWAAPASATSPWITKYVFPGGYIPAVSEVMSAVENARLWATDVECWRLHYAYTLRHWYDRFCARKDEARALYDDRFVRMWRFYLAASEQTFRHAPQAVYQLQLSRHVNSVPLTRDYLYNQAATEPRSDSIGNGKPVIIGERDHRPLGAVTSNSSVISFKEKSHDR